MLYPEVVGRDRGVTTEAIRDSGVSSNADTGPGACNNLCRSCGEPGRWGKTTIRLAKAAVVDGMGPDIASLYLEIREATAITVTMSDRPLPAQV